MDRKLLKHNVLRRWLHIVVMGLVLSVSLYWWISVSQAQTTIVVNSLTDDKNNNDGECTLREAIIAVNNGEESGKKKGECNPGRRGGPYTIELPAGTIILDRSDSGKEDAAATGDLDILADVTIMGKGTTGPITRTTTISAVIGFNDRIFHILLGTVNIQGVTITGGNVSEDGGGIYNLGDLTVTGSVVTGNMAAGAGGGIYNASTGTLDLSKSTVHDNEAGTWGGGIANAGLTADVANSTISGNRAGGDGAGISNSTMLNLSNTTVTLNDATGAAGGLDNTGTVKADNNILAGNTAGSSPIDCRNASSFNSRSGGYNLFIEGPDFNTCAQDSDIELPVGTLIDTVLDVNLAVNQPASGDPWPTLTHALAAGSPAIDAGDNLSCTATDQRGVIRPAGLTCDIGAYEAEDPTQTGPDVTVNTSDVLVDDAGCTYTHCSLIEAIDLANSDSDTTTIHFTDLGPISPEGALPAFTQPVIIDGIQPGGSMTSIVGTGDCTEEPAISGLTIEAGPSAVSGLELSAFSGDGIEVAGVVATISNNSIHDNCQLGIDLLADLNGDGVLDSDGVTPNGTAGVQNYPTVTTIFNSQGSASGNDYALLTASLDGSFSDGEYTIEFFENASCDGSGNGEGQTFLASKTLKTDANGDGRLTVAVPMQIPLDSYITATATDPSGQTSEFSPCKVVYLNNISWVTALPINPGTEPAVVDMQARVIDIPGQSRWYKFIVRPGSRVIIKLTDLPDNYDLTLYKDIADAYEELLTPEDLYQLDAEFAPDIFSPDIFSPDIFSPDIFSPDIFSPDIFSPDIFSPDIFSPDIFSPDIFSPDIFSPDIFSPDIFSPDIFSPDMFSSAQMRSLIGVSGFGGTTSEGISVNTWNNGNVIDCSSDPEECEYFYIRVRGRNGAFNPNSAFNLNVVQLPGECGSVGPVSGATVDAVAGDYNTIILTDMNRMEGSDGEKATLMGLLEELAAGAQMGRDEVNGVIVDLADHPRVVNAHDQADANPACPYAKNLVAEEIKAVIDSYRPLQYIVLVGNDYVIPFFRHPDQALLANEENYVPPVSDNSASQASLKLGYVLSQDRYGSDIELSIKDHTFPVPGIPTGRLVETTADAIKVVEAYLGPATATYANGVISPQTAYVTGYDFLEDAADGVKQALEEGLDVANTANTVDTLISDSTVSPLDVCDSLPGVYPLDCSWTADQLRADFLNNAYDITFLAGHFSASSALAADYSSRFVTSELMAADDMPNRLVYSGGCHAAYNIVNDDGILGVTQEPDWAQAFASKGATLIAGTGYQYGDTDFIEYSERLYLEFSRQLGAADVVSIGDALVAAKQAYLADTPELRGIHEKSLLIATIFGLPMLRVDLPGSVAGSTDVPEDLTLISAGSNPGQALGLEYADLTVDTTLVLDSRTLDDVTADPPSTQEAFFYSNNGDVFTSPGEPVLPSLSKNVTVDGTVLRGVGFRGSTYVDNEGLLPLTGAPTTEIRNAHSPFVSQYFYPVQMWGVNYFEALAADDEEDRTTRLMLTPAQFRSDPNYSLGMGTLRGHDNLELRLYYSNNIGEYDCADGVCGVGDGNSTVPALASPPAIARISSIVDESESKVTFRMTVLGPSAGVQEVWVTYTSEDETDAGIYGRWQSLDLSRNNGETARWEEELLLPDGVLPGDIRYVVQAVNGVGLVSLAVNVGDYYIPGEETTAGNTPTKIEFVNPEEDPNLNPTEGAYGTTATFRARLTLADGMTPLPAGQLVVFGLNSQGRLAVTDADGFATAVLNIVGVPGLDAQQVRATYYGSSLYQPSFTSSDFFITKQPTNLTLSDPDPDPDDPDGLFQGRPEDPALVTATLMDGTGRRLREKTIFFVLQGSNGTAAGFSIITNFLGQATLGDVPLGPGDYALSAYFNGMITLPTDEGPEVLNLEDDLFASSSATGALRLVSDPPIALGDGYSTPEDTELVVPAPGVLGNDSDPDGDPLTAVLVSGPAVGSLDFSGDGSFTYMPPADYFGTASFVYKANDGLLDSNEATVIISIEPVNDAPVAVDDGEFFVNAGDTISIDVLANDSDVDGDTLSIVQVTQPLSGTVTNNGSSLDFEADPSSGGPYSFTYTVSDGFLTDTATVTVVVNAAPTCGLAEPDDMSIWPVNKEFHRVTIFNVSDPDGVDDDVIVTFTGIYQDEPVDTFDGILERDESGEVIPGSPAWVRADRLGSQDGRVYHITFEAVDDLGATCSGVVLTATAVVHDRADAEAIDSGPPYYNSETGEEIPENEVPWLMNLP